MKNFIIIEKKLHFTSTFFLPDDHNNTIWILKIYDKLYVKNSFIINIFDSESTGGVHFYHIKICEFLEIDIALSG